MKNSIFFTEKTIPPLFVIIFSFLGIVVLFVCFSQGIFSSNELKNSLWVLIFAFFVSFIFFSDSVKENKAQMNEIKKEKKYPKIRFSLDKILGLIIVFLSILALAFVFLESVLQFLFDTSLVGL